MDISNDTATNLSISQEVVCTIATEAIKELDGVYSLADLPAKSTALKKINPIATIVPPRQIKMTQLGDSAHIDVGIIVNLNYKIRDVAEQAQNAIKKSVQDMTGITVSKVNIFVTGVHLKDDTAK